MTKQMTFVRGFAASTAHKHNSEDAQSLGQRWTLSEHVAQEEKDVNPGTAEHLTCCAKRL
jgi:hypothetical protein